jgi:hypothetical protein
VVLYVVSGQSATIARQDLTLTGSTVEAVDVTVDCALVSTSGDEEWGTAAGVLCAGPALRRLALAGGVAIAGGLIGVALSSDRWQRRWGDPRTDQPATFRHAVRLGSTAVGVAGLCAVSLGLGLRLFSDEVTDLTADETVALAAIEPVGEVLSAFEVVSLSGTSGGRYEEETWVVVRTTTAGGEDVDAVVQALTEAGWSAGEVDADFTDGWVAQRGTAGSNANLVEVGLVSDALGEDADVSANARRLLDGDLPPEPAAVAVRIAPSRIA